jgi:hypothetical protein
MYDTEFSSGFHRNILLQEDFFLFPHASLYFYIYFYNNHLYLFHLSTTSFNRHDCSAHKESDYRSAIEFMVREVYGCGDTALFCASKHGRSDVMECLLETRAVNLLATDENRKTVYMLL